MPDGDLAIGKALLQFDGPVLYGLGLVGMDTVFQVIRVGDPQAQVMFFSAQSTLMMAA